MICNGSGNALRGRPGISTRFSTTRPTRACNGRSLPPPGETIALQGLTANGSARLVWPSARPVAPAGYAIHRSAESGHLHRGAGRGAIRHRLALPAALRRCRHAACVRCLTPHLAECLHGSIATSCASIAHRACHPVHQPGRRLADQRRGILRTAQAIPLPGGGWLQAVDGARRRCGGPGPGARAPERAHTGGMAPHDGAPAYAAAGPDPLPAVAARMGVGPLRDIPRTRPPRTTRRCRNSAGTWATHAARQGCRCTEPGHLRVAPKPAIARWPMVSWHSGMTAHPRRSFC